MQALVVSLAFAAGTSFATEYKNERWGFRIWLPALAIDCIYESSAPDHGVLIHLAGQDCQGAVIPPRLGIAVEYDALDHGSLENLANRACPEGHELSLLSFNSLPMRECRKPEENGMVLRRLIAFRRTSGTASVPNLVYTVWWESSAETADETAINAQQIIRSVSFLPSWDER